MSTSNVTTFNMTSSQLVNAAMRKLAVLGDGQVPSATQLTNGVEALNAMLKTFTVKGMPLWVMSEYSMALTSSRTYTFDAAHNIPAPLKVTQAILVDQLGGSIPMNLKSHYDYNLLPTTAASGTPINYWYEPLNQSGVMHVWPTPDGYSITNCTIKFVYQRPFQDMVTTTDTLDLPQWWHEAVIYGLAWRLCGDFGIPLQDRQIVAKEAEYFLEEALSFGTEEGSLYLSPSWNGH